MMRGNKIKHALCVLAVLPNFVFAQRDSAKAAPVPFFNIGSGLCFSNASSNGTAWMDYVRPGYVGSLSAQWPLFHSFWGISASFNYLHNAYNMDKYAAQQQAMVPLSAVTAVSYGAFNQFFLMAGAYASATCHKFTFTLNARVGAEYLALPNYEVNYVFTSAEAPYNYTKIYNHVLAVAFGADVSASYRVSKKVAATLQAGLLAANAKYTGTVYKDSYMPGLSFHVVTPVNESVQVLMLNAQVGISYYLNKK